MKNKIKYLFVIITPFQKLVIDQLFGEKLKLEESLVLLNDIVVNDDILCNKETIINYEFSRKKLFKEPFTYLKRTKQNVRKVKSNIQLVNKKFQFSKNLEIYLGTDKDIYTQLLLNDLYKHSNEYRLTLVDEGLGYYVNLNFKDRMLSLMYKLLTPIIFGSRLYYIKRLGVYPKINNIYLRTPELLNSKNKDINYVKFNLKNKTNTFTNIKEGKVLLYSFPNQDGTISSEAKIKIIQDIGRYLATLDKDLIIKPHPRENIYELKTVLGKQKNVRILDNKFTGEDINYFEFELIINFFSSIVIDILDKNYPKNKILTIGFNKKPQIHFSKNLKYCYIKKFKASHFINFDQ